MNTSPARARNFTASVPALAALAVSFHLPGEVSANFAITGRYARQTNYISPPGNFIADRVMPVGNLSDQWLFLCGVDVLASSETGGVVALGDSLTDGNISTIDAYCRWPDQLARRLHPDRHAHVTAQMRERWHAAQQAYLAGDVDLLDSPNGAPGFNGRFFYTTNPLPLELTALAKILALTAVGRKEASENTVSVRHLGSSAQSRMGAHEAITALAKEAMPPDLREGG